VFDPAGRPLYGLQAANFAVFEDDKAITLKSVTSITDENIPLGIVLVIDTIQSMDETPLNKAKAAALAFVDQVRAIDELALISFSSTVKELQPMTKDRAVIKAKIDDLTSSGQTALYDTIVQAVKTAQTSTAKRRVIILLTDGNEYGHISKVGGEDAYKTADKAGIPVFTIGLGFDIDANYLKAVADNTGGAFYQSPRPEDLGKVYAQIGTLLRSLYVLTVDTALPADGSTHRIRVDFQADGATGSAQDNARYPAPIPVVRLSGIDPTVPLDKTATVKPEVVADNKLTGYEYQIDGKAAASGDGEPKSLDVNPIKLLPGPHSLTLSVRDDKDHVGQGKLDFQVAALPPEFAVEGLKAGETISGNRTVTLKVGDSQSPVSTAIFDIDGTVLSTVQRAPYAVALDVLSRNPAAPVHGTIEKRGCGRQAVGRVHHLPQSFPDGDRQCGSAGDTQCPGDVDGHADAHVHADQHRTAADEYHNQHEYGCSTDIACQSDGDGPGYRPGSDGYACSIGYTPGDGYGSPVRNEHAAPDRYTGSFGHAVQHASANQHTAPDRYHDGDHQHGFIRDGDVTPTGTQRRPPQYPHAAANHTPTSPLGGLGSLTSGPADFCCAGIAESLVIIVIVQAARASRRAACHRLQIGMESGWFDRPLLRSGRSDKSQT
jgi:VWFA-related protein